MAKPDLMVFGIKQCDTVRKARRWLDEKKMEYRFHDLRVDGFSQKTLTQWLQSTELDTLVNRRSTTWRQLPQQLRDSADKAQLGALLLEHPALVKRPVFSRAGRVLAVGFTNATENLLEQSS